MRPPAGRRGGWRWWRRHPSETWLTPQGPCPAVTRTHNRIGSAQFVMTSRVPFAERGGAIRGALDLVSGRFPRFVFGGRLDDDLLPAFHFHEVSRDTLEPQLRYLAENGYRTVTSDEIDVYVRGNARFDGPRVALCF